MKVMEDSDWRMDDWVCGLKGASCEGQIGYMNCANTLAQWLEGCPRPHPFGSILHGRIGECLCMQLLSEADIGLFHLLLYLRFPVPHGPTNTHI